MVYTAYPSSTLDPDRGTGSRRAKKARHVEVNEYDDRDQIRQGYQEMDRIVSADQRYTQAQRDAGRSTPRERTAPLRHPKMERTLPAPAQVRRPISSRQRKDRSITKNVVQDRLSKAQHQAMESVLTDDGWRATGDALSEVVGDAQMLPPAQLRHVQRIDRAIQEYERGNERGHVVYANVELPPYINSSNVEGYVKNNLPAGRHLTFDRYTAGAHCMHEVEPDPGQAHHTVVMEIQTRRGMYLGGSDSVDDTGHLLPRGIRLQVTGSHLATYERPDGTPGERLVLQMVDSPPTPTPNWRQR